MQCYTVVDHNGYEGILVQTGLRVGVPIGEKLIPFSPELASLEAERPTQGSRPGDGAALAVNHFGHLILHKASLEISSDCRARLIPELEGDSPNRALVQIDLSLSEIGIDMSKSPAFLATYPSLSIKSSVKRILGRNEFHNDAYRNPAVTRIQLLAVMEEGDEMTASSTWHRWDARRIWLPSENPSQRLLTISFDGKSISGIDFRYRSADNFEVSERL